MRRSQLLVGSLSLCLLVTAPFAHAQLGETDGVSEPGETTGIDTDLTPVAKADQPFFERIAGAEYGQTAVPDDSPTPFDADFFDVAFRNERIGYAGGAECQSEPATPQDTKTCTRVPVVYRYFDPLNAPAAWQEVYHGTKPGYVGAIAFTPAGNPVAVGGDGAYPRREPTPTGPDATYERRVSDDAAVGAGMARAWVGDASGTFDEITDELPQGMRGLSALDFHPTFDTGFAGALGQIWEWRDGRFSGTRFDRDTQSPGSRAALFEFRVREIRFLVSGDRTQAVAVTSGCCTEADALNAPRVLVYNGDRPQGAMWFVRNLGYDPTDYDPLTGSLNLDPTDGTGSHRRLEQRPWAPDSIYSSILRDRGNGTFRMSAVVTPGGPATDAAAPEPASVISDANAGVSGSFGINQDGKNIGDAGGTLILGLDPATPHLQLGGLSIGERGAQGLNASSARLVSADGDAEPAPGGNDTVRGNGNPDWVVGELRATATSLGARAIAASTRFDLRPRPQDSVEADVANGNVGADAGKLEASVASRYRALPTYGLNAIDVIGLTGQGWAVGDHGALVRLGEGAAVGGAASPEPPAPRLGAPTERRLDGEALGAGGPPTSAGAAGPVPPLASAQEEQLAEPRWTPWGSPDSTEAVRVDPREDVRELVMARDGSEGWAIGPSPAVGGSQEAIMSLHAFDGSAWEDCDPEGVRGQVEPDPACAELEPLLRARGPANARVRLLSAARVPLENDTDPTNDDELEIVAVGTLYKQIEPQPFQFKFLPVILRYRDGTWALEDESAREAVALDNVDGGLREVAFSAPDDGWAVSLQGKFFHFDGERWIACGVANAPPECGDPDGRLADPQLQVSSLTSVGERVYLGGTRTAGGTNTIGAAYPVVLFREAGGEWQSGEGALDPGFGKNSASADPDAIAGEDAAAQGGVTALALGARPDGSYEGWALGAFGGLGVEGAAVQRGSAKLRATALMRLEPGAGWRPWTSPDAAADYLLPDPRFRAEDAGGYDAVNDARALALPGLGDAAGRAYIARRGRTTLLGFDPERERWELVPVGMLPDAEDGRIQALAPDGEGGAWAAVGTGDEGAAAKGGASDSYFYRLTDHPPREVFEEVGHPVDRGAITSAVGAVDGSLWVATDTDEIYRYDRAAGWERARIPGWDPGRVVTNPSPVNAVAVGPGGEGLAVGRGGRIARLEPGGIRLDDAAGRVCDLGGPVAPCGTGRDLRAAAIAPDGSALVGGDALALLWRPAGGDFRAVARPAASLAATITGISMPSPERAYLTLDTGQIYAGALVGGEWAWRVENETAGGDLLAIDSARNLIALRSIAVDAGGHGYAVGDRGLVLERTGDPSQPWRRLDLDFTYDLTSVALPAGGGAGALVGGQHGLILTASGERFAPARAPDPYRPASGDVVGLAALPGYAPGQVEAWAAIGRRTRGLGGIDLRDGSAQLLHFTSDPDEALLGAGTNASPLADAPAPRPGEIALAAFGNTDCLGNSSLGCPEMTGSSYLNERIAARVVDEVAARAGEPGGPAFAVFTGDAADSGGWTGTTVAKQATGAQHQGTNLARTYGSIKHSRWSELVADRLEDQGVPLLGAIGAGDVSETTACDLAQTGACVTTRDGVKTGENLSWREAMTGRMAPWGLGGEEVRARYAFEPVEGGDPGVLGEVDPDDRGPLPPIDPEGGAARTHYAVDITDPASGEPVARLVVVDSSLRSLQASDPIQQPAEPEGQLDWLEQMVCVRGGQSNTGQPCTREPGVPAIVVSNTPTYSYGPGIGTDTATDGSVFEALIQEHLVSAVVSGRLGWNGLYYSRAVNGAPVDHIPAPGEAYPERAPEPLAGGNRPIPFVVASGTGGKFGPNGEGSGVAAEGYWHGYTIVRVPADGDPTGVVVEQRPIYDWVELVAARHVIRPRQRLQLAGLGRSPLGPPEASSPDPFDEITSAAITHRYDLLAAEPEKPWLPAEDATSAAADGPDECGEYVCLAEEIATVDDQSGEVRAGAGKHPPTYAIALLSVGETAAAYPLRFEQSPSFKAQTRTSPTIPPNPASPPPPPAAEPPSIPAFNPPSFSSPPVPPPLALVPPAALAATEAQPPTPPVPPPAVPANPAPSPLDLSFAPTGLTVAPQASVIPPPAPPIQPAPPGGARKEARQRQAAAQKGGADSGEGAEETQDGGGDLVDSRAAPPGSAYTRHDARRHAKERPVPSITALPRSGADSGSSAVLYGGGLTIAALALAIGWSLTRPTPRPRTSREAAPAWARRRV